MDQNEPLGASTDESAPAQGEVPRRVRRRPAKAAKPGAEASPSPDADPAAEAGAAAATGRDAAKTTSAEKAPPTAEAAPRTRTRRAKIIPAAASQEGVETGESTLFNVELELVPKKATRGRKRASAAAPALDTASELAAPDGRAAGPPDIAPSEPARLPPTTAVFFIAPAETASAHPARATAAEDAAEAPAEPAARRTRRVRGTADRAAPERAEPSATEVEVEAEMVPEAGRSRRSRRGRRIAEPAEPVEVEAPPATEFDDGDEDEDVDGTGRRRRRGRRGRGRGRGPLDEFEGGDEAPIGDEDETEPAADDEEPLTRRRRRRRRSGSGDQEAPPEEGVVTVVKIRQPRTSRDEVQGVTGSTRLEAKRQRRRDGREQRRTRPPILSESEFLARREAVDRMMVVRQKGDRTQVAVLEDKILVEHYVTRQSASTMVGNVYLGKVQNVLPSMEAAFIDIGRGRNAVLYAGEVNWDASGLEGKARSIEQALKSGDSVLVQVTKDPVGHKGARLTSHVALSGRHLVYVPNGHASGISRKLSDVERRRLRDVLKNLVPDGAGVIVRTAAEGAAEDDLARDVKRLQSQWEDIQAKASNGHAPALLSSEPDLVIRVVRDLFNEDFREVIIQGTEAYEQVEEYLGQVSPDLVERVRRHTGSGDAFAELRIDEQILKGLDRKVYLPSGGHLVIDRTEAMTVVDVNTGKYTGAGGNLEETVTRNNLEAAEEIVRQLRLRDLGGIVVIDFIDMVLESNRELVLRRLTECLGRDRTKHQVTEITSLGLVQMTRKRIGQGLLEAFSESCDHCKGRGLIIHTEPVAERARTNVAEKVRAVAASTNRADQAADEAADEIDVPGLDLDDADLGPAGIEADELDAAAEGQRGRDGDGEQVEDIEDGANGSVRRRTRRASSRRRTRP
jgi:ribonuclease E